MFGLIPGAFVPVCDGYATVVASIVLLFSRCIIDFQNTQLKFKVKLF